MDKISLKVLQVTIIVLGAVFISLASFHNNIWFDESFSIGMANHSIIDIWKVGGNDVHPVLYYWMLRGVNILSKGSILMYRIFSVLPAVLLGVLGITHINKDFGIKTGVLFSFFSYFLPAMAVYANQIRMYSWALYIVTILAIYSYRIYLGQNSKKNWFIFLIMSLASLYIHYYALIATVIINIFLLIHFISRKEGKELKKEVCVGIIQMFLYLPWLVNLLNQMKRVSHGFWISFIFPDTIYEIIGCQMNGASNSTEILTISCCINVVLFIVLAIVIIKKRKNRELDFKPAKYCIILYLIVILISLIVTIILDTSVLYHRYLFVITGLYIFALSHILAQSNNKYLVIIVCIIVFILGLYHNIIQIKDNYAKENQEPIRYLKENVQKDDVFVYDEIGSGFVCATIFESNKQYYYNKNEENWGAEDGYKVWVPQLETCITKNFLKKCTGRIWVIGTCSNSCYEELFENEKFIKIIYKQFNTKYKNYNYNITLVERKK